MTRGTGVSTYPRSTPPFLTSLFSPLPPWLSWSLCPSRALVSTLPVPTPPPTPLLLPFRPPSPLSLPSSLPAFLPLFLALPVPSLPVLLPSCPSFFPPSFPSSFPPPPPHLFTGTPRLRVWWFPDSWIRPEEGGERGRVGERGDDLGPLRPSPTVPIRHPRGRSGRGLSSGVGGKQVQ